jgi:hypothetical protein
VDVCRTLVSPLENKEREGKNFKKRKAKEKIKEIKHERLHNYRYPTEKSYGTEDG